jgi:sensor histidine kinase YesM
MAGACKLYFISYACKTVSPVIQLLPHKKRFRFWKLGAIMLTIFSVWFILATILSYIIPELFINSSNDDWSALWDNVKEFAFHTVLFYFTLNYYYHLIAEKRSFPHYFLVSIVTAVFYTAYLAFRDYNFKSLKLSSRITPGVVVYGYSISILLMIGLSLLVAYLVYLRDEKKQRKILEEEKLQLEIEKSHANFNFLKAQINPHFLHNTLNFLYAKSLPYSPELSEGILTLSDIMRYALGEASIRDKTALKDEIEHVRNVIKIHQLRFSNSLQVNFEVAGVINGTTIIPFVLITIVENAFKHGDLKNTEHPIDIKLSVENNNIRFRCYNKKKAGPKELSTGIGLDNIKKRLDLAYRDQYTLAIKDGSAFYTTELTINTL